MSKKYNAPAELRTLEELLVNFSYRNGFNIRDVFNDMLTFIIQGYSPGAPPLEHWRYEKEHNKVFYQMYCEWVLIMEKQIKKYEWFDALGEIFMSVVISTNEAQRLQQYFTPAPICDMMTKIINNDNTFGPGKRINDPACGSGRMLLAFHVKHLGNYLIGEDLDRTCCMMSVCNFLIHGCTGEIVQHDALKPSTFLGGWKVNEHLNSLGFPSIRAISEKESIVWRNWERERIRLLQKSIQAKKQQNLTIA